MFLLLSTFAFGLIVFVSGHEVGAPLEACPDFRTKHHVDHDESKPRYEENQQPAPYKITLNPASVAPGGKIQVNIEGVGNEKFKGFIIQANDASGKIVGNFVDLEKHPETQALNCPGGDPGNTATHTGPAPKDKSSVELHWKAPGDFSGAVTFKATVVKEYSTFWYDIKSSPLTVG